MNSLDTELSRRLAELDEQSLRRRLRAVESPQTPELLVGGRDLLSFSSNDYLGLSNHPRLREAMIEGVQRFGVGAGASRLICGNLRPHVDLDEAIAEFKGVEAALSFSTGYATALGAICSLVSKDDILLLDRLVHASIIDAARLSRATLRVYDHNELGQLEDLLKWSDGARCKKEGSRSQVLIVTESVFSMDGDLAPLRDIIALKERYGAWLMVDEAHGTGLYGEHRRGVIEAMEMGGFVEVQMGTLGKALGVSGGYIAGSRALIDWLVNRARSFIFSTAPPPAVAARWTLPAAQSAILPLRVGAEETALAVAAKLLEQGLWVPAIRYPSVARGEARLRLTVTAAHTLGQIDRLGAALRSCASQPIA